MAGWFVLPGLPWALLWRRRAGLDLLDSLALILALGLSVGAVASSLLTVIGLLRPQVLIGVLGAASLVGFGLLAALVVRSSLAAARRGDQRSPPARLPVRKWLPALVLALAFIVLLVPQFLIALPEGLPRDTTSWYYWNLSRLTAETGGLPSSVMEWGSPRPFKADYLPFTTHLAAVEALDPGRLATLETYRLAVLVCGGVLLIAFARRWTLAGGVLLGGLLASSNLWIAKFGSLRPEAFAVALLLGALWAIDRAWLLGVVSRPGLAWALLAGLLGGLTAAAHLEVFLVGGAVGLALLVLDGRGVVEARRRSTAVAGVVAAAVAVALLASSGGGLPGEGELGVGLGRPAQGEAAAGLDDQSWRVYRAIIGPDAPAEPPGPPADPAYLAPTARFPWFGIDFLGPSGALLGVLLLAAAAVVLARHGTPVPRGSRDRPEGQLLLFGLAVIAMLLIGSLALFMLFPTYVPRRIGLRRLLPYEIVGLAAILTAGVLATKAAWVESRPESGSSSLDRDPPAPLGRRGALTLGVGLACAIVAIGLMGASASRLMVNVEAGSISYDGRDAYLWLARNAPSDSRILVNGYTDGVVAGLAERPGIVDGRAPYGEDPGWVAQAERDANLARDFFARPSSSTLAQLGADYVVVGPGSDLATSVNFPTDAAAIAALPDVAPAAQLGSVTVYEVLER
ncbi:MAG: hypothetical protein H0X16_09960 [Chloroflexi bacterium]|nr:hypothetical protein [Chloroflexota bacterium]